MCISFFVFRYAPFGEGHPDDHYTDAQQGADQVHVWGGLMKNGTVFGPYFIRGNMNCREYLRIVRYNLIQRDFHTHNIDANNVWFQQDGAPSHTASSAINYLSQKFPGKLISKKGSITWPPRSPDLTNMDFFFWGYVKHAIWNVPRDQQPSTINELKQCIEREFQRVPVAFVRNSFDGMIRRCRKCVNRRGRTFSNE